MLSKSNNKNSNRCRSIDHDAISLSLYLSAFGEFIAVILQNATNVNKSYIWWFFAFVASIQQIVISSSDGSSSNTLSIQTRIYVDGNSSGQEAAVSAVLFDELAPQPNHATRAVLVA